MTNKIYNIILLYQFLYLKNVKKNIKSLNIVWFIIKKII